MTRVWLILFVIYGVAIVYALLTLSMMQSDLGGPNLYHIQPPRDYFELIPDALRAQW